MNYTFHGKNLHYHHGVIENPNPINYIIHSHEQEYQLLVIFSGHLSYFIEGRFHHLQPPCAVLVRPKQSHHPFYLDSVTNYHYATFNIKVCKQNNNVLNRLEKAFSHTSFLTLLNPKIILNILQQVDEYITSFPKKLVDNILPLKLNELVFVFSESICPTQYSSSEEYPLFRNIIQFIDQNRYTLQSVQEILKRFKISKSQLYNLFQKELNCPPMTYVLNGRLSNAHNLIKSGKKPSEIFFLCGFSDYPNFYRLYKKKYNISPSETYKNSLKEPIE